MVFRICLGVAIISLCIALSHQQDARKKKNNTICDLPCKQTPMNIMFVIDASSSIWEANFTKGLWFVEDFVDVFKIHADVIRVAAVSFGDSVYTEDAFGFDAYTNKAALKTAIRNIPYRAGTSTETGAAIRYARKTFYPTARKNVKTICIVLTDGNSQKTAVTKKEARRARDAGVEMFAVGIGHDVTEQELRNIAGVDSHVFVVTSYNLLKTIRSRLAFETCDEKPSNEIICRDNPIDISLVIDASVSIGPSNFSIGMDFVKDVVESFDVSPKRARFSVITYGRGTYENTAFDFDTYKDEVGVVNAIDRIPYTAGDYTDTGLGIRFMREVQMLPKQRADAVHIAIVLTDGQSQEWEITRDEAEESRNAGINIFAIGVGTNPSDDELLDIAGQADRVFRVTDYRALGEIMKELDNKTCDIALQAYHSYPLS